MPPPPLFSHPTAGGNGFVTDPATIRANGISDANPFFRSLMGKPYLDRVVISPHVYVSPHRSSDSCPFLHARLASASGFPLSPTPVS